MKSLRQCMVLALLVLISLTVSVIPIQAQDDLWADSCQDPYNACQAGAQNSLINCNSSCDKQYGSGTSGDKTCRNSCTNSYNASIAVCSRSKTDCLNQRAGACTTQCQIDCSGTTGSTSCSYNDGIRGCNSSCGCSLPAPLCPNPQCGGNPPLWQCYSPILIDVAGRGFKMTDAENGVEFDLLGRGRRPRLGWTARGAQNGWLALDRNGNGRIDDGQELFGNMTAQPKSADPNGFLALAVFDSPEHGGNGDGFIDEHDAIYEHLLVWIDSNHDGISQPEELFTLPQVGFKRIDLHYAVKPYTDQYGNYFRLRARIWDFAGHQDGRWAWDVYLDSNVAQHCEGKDFLNLK